MYVWDFTGVGSTFVVDKHWARSPTLPSPRECGPCAAVIDVDEKILVLMARGDPMHFGSPLAPSLLRFSRC
jgi:hypothetical protein